MIPFFTILLPMILLFSGLALDVGLLEWKMLQLQNAADAAALGARLEAERGTNNWIAMGKADAGVNGFTDGSNNVTVTVAQQPTTGAYAGDYDAIQATVTQTVSTIFMGAINGGKLKMSAQAVSLMTPCLYLMGTGSLTTYSLDAYSGSLLSASCPVYVNTRMYDESYGNIAVDAINVAGSSSASNISGFAYPSPHFNSPTLSDPLAAVASPAFSSCTYTSYSLSSGTATLSPGTYCKGITLTNSTVTLNPGLYIITGGATWSGSTVTGAGVTLFFTKGGGGSYGQFIIQNSSNVNLSAPTSSSSGSIATILVFADRSWVATGAQDFQLVNSTIQGDGIWYLTGAGFSVWSCGTFQATHYFGLVADNVRFGGTYFDPGNNYSYVPTGNPFRPSGGLVQ
jgi:Flp pilus assembly protein TadG